MRSFSASDGLAATGIDGVWLGRVMTRIDPQRIPIREAPAWFMRFWAEGIVAVAMPWAIYLSPAMMDLYDTGAEPQRVGRLLVHELAHMEQLERLGVVRHVAQYVADYLGSRVARRSHWDSYRSIRLEVEARSVARLVMDGPQ